jgi:hypothetical protein
MYVFLYCEGYSIDSKSQNVYTIYPIPLYVYSISNSEAFLTRYLFPRVLQPHNILTGKSPPGKLEGGILCNGHVCAYGPVPVHSLEADCTGDPECMLWV